MFDSSVERIWHYIGTKLCVRGGRPAEHADRFGYVGRDYSEIREVLRLFHQNYFPNERRQNVFHGRSENSHWTFRFPQLDILFFLTFLTLSFVQKLKTFIDESGDGKLFDEHHRIGYLTYKSRKQLVCRIVDMIQTKFTLGAKEKEIAEVCKAAIALFPSLQQPASQCGGIVCTKSSSVIQILIIF